MKLAGADGDLLQPALATVAWAIGLTLLFAPLAVRAFTRRA